MVLKQQFKMPVEEELIKALIIKYDESIRLQRKLFECGFAEALLSVIPINMKNQDALEALLNKRANECERLKKYLETARDKVSKLFAKHEENTHLKQFLDFAFFLSTSRDSDEDEVESNSGAKNLLQCHGYGIGLSSKDTLAEELNRNNKEHESEGVSNEHESEGVGLQFYEMAINLMSKLSIGNEQSPDASDEIFSKQIRKPTSKPAKWFNSTISPKSHFECATCGKSFPLKNSEKKLVKCPICDMHDTENADEEINKLPIVALEEKRNDKSQKTGDFSGKTQSKISKFSKKPHLGTHIRQAHHGEKLYGCMKCDKRFATNSSLKKHALVHGSQRLFQCSVCDALFKCNHNKKKHEQVIHEGNAPLQCAHCDKRCNNKNQLISHIYTKHFSEIQKQFVCRICDKSFPLERGLQSHKLTHTSKKPFKCSVCDQVFKYCETKACHEQRVHGIGVHFRCQHCDKGYSKKIFLTRHLQKKHAE